MNLKQRIVRTMMNGLPPEEQVLMVTDFLNWLFSNYTPAERQKKLAFWTPKLVEDMSAGIYGLWLLIFHYMKYLVSLRWLRYWSHPVKAPREDHISR
jgi:hypothetical protein